MGLGLLPPQPMSNHTLTAGPLPFGKMVLGQRDYKEFVCSKSTAGWLQGGAMTHLDGQKVTLRIVDEFDGGHNVMVRIWTQDSP